MRRNRARATPNIQLLAEDRPGACTKTLALSGFAVTNAADGSLRVIPGTDSAFEGVTTLYYDSVSDTPVWSLALCRPSPPVHFTPRLLASLTYGISKSWQGMGMTSVSNVPDYWNALTTRIRSVRTLTETLAVSLTPEDCCAQSMPDASPTKWHLAHSSWFFETFLLATSARYRKFDPSFDYLFNSYYEAVGARHPRSARGLLTRPTLADVMSYRENITEQVIAFVGAQQVSGRCILIDDVVTSGETAREAASALCAAGAEEVVVVALARTPLQS